MEEGWDGLYRSCRHAPAHFVFVLYERTAAAHQRNQAVPAGVFPW